MKNLFAVTLVLIFGYTASVQAQGFAINHDGANPHPLALLELEWSNQPQGFLAPRMAQADLPASPVAGLIVYQTDGDFPGFYQYIGSEWVPLRHNSFKGFVNQLGLSTPGSVTGTSAGIVQTDGANMVTSYDNTGTAAFDLSAYSFTGTPVVVASAEYQNIAVPDICNGTWGDGVTDNNHLHKFYLAALSSLGTPIINYETDLAPSFGINSPAFGSDRAIGYEPLTMDDNPPGRYVYYDIDAPAASNSVNWDSAGDGNDQFPHPNATTWTGGQAEVYLLTPLVAGDVYQIQIQPFFDNIIEVANPFMTQVAVYIDYNKDGDFDDTQEVIYQFTQNTWSIPETQDFSIPTSAINGVTKMRIVIQRSDGGGGQTGINPDLLESCLANFSDIYSGHTIDFDVEITGGEPPFNFDGKFCNVSEPNEDGFIIRCYNENGVLEDVRFHFNVYDKF